MKHMDFQSHQFERVTNGDYRARVRSVVGTDGWTAAMDLHLIENAWRGVPVGLIVATMGVQPGQTITPQQAVARRKAIIAAITYRDDVPLEHRGLVMAELRAAAGLGV